MKKTALHEQHLASNAKMIDFFGWQMPIHYGSSISEHLQVRQQVGMFDVSHMTVVDVIGMHADQFLRHVLANDIARLDQEGRALYSLMLNEQGGVIDDLIVYRQPWGYRLIVNCATRDKDLAWLNQQSANYDVEIHEKPDLSIIAVQGPNARQVLQTCLQSPLDDVIAGLKLFHSAISGHWMIAATGYTGEDGIELVLPHDDAQTLWAKLLAQGVPPIGLGARDSLRMEAGLCLYGQDMDETTNPLEAGLSWTIALQSGDRQFIGRSVIEQTMREGPQYKQIGLVLLSRGVMRPHQTIHFTESELQGTVTSGGFSPTLNMSIAIAQVPIEFAQVGGACLVDIRGRQHAARMVNLPFVRKGKSLVANDLGV